MKIINKKARFNYELSDRYEAGIVLTGGEVKTIKQKRADISQAFVKIKDNEAYLINANIPLETHTGQDPTRTRKLLLNKREITSILSKIKGKRLTVVPTKLYTKKRLIKLEIALAKPKRRFQKKESLKRADLDREVERELRESKLRYNSDSRK